MKAFFFTALRSQNFGMRADPLLNLSDFYLIRSFIEYKKYLVA